VIAGMIAERRSETSSLSNPTTWLKRILGGVEVDAGIDVTDDTALSSSAVLCAINNISQCMAMQPLHLYERDQGAKGFRNLAREHPLYSLMHDAPNPEMTSYEMRQWLQAALLVRGAGYANIVWDNAGQVRELWPLDSAAMKVKRGSNKKLVYEYTLPDGQKETLLPYEVLHLRGFYRKGLLGEGLQDLGRQAIGRTLAVDKFVSLFFKNGANAGAYLKTDKSLGDKSFERLRKWMQERHQGLSNAHRMAILEEGLSWEQTGINPRDSQLLEARQFEVQEVCRIFNITPHRLFELSRSTFNNIEHQGIEFVQYTIGPWNENWQQRLNLSLLTREERQRYYFKFIPELLLRGDVKAQADAFHIYRQDGIYNADEIRELLDMNPQPNGQGQMYLVPVNLMPAKEMASSGSPVAGNDKEDDERAVDPTLETRARSQRKAAARFKLRTAWARVLKRDIKRLVRGEIREIRKLVKKHLGTRDESDFEEALRDYYENPDLMPAQVASILEPVFESYAEAIAEAVAAEEGADEVPDLGTFTDEYLAAYTAGHSARHLNELLKVMRESEDDPAQAIEERLDEWEAKKAEKIGDWEAVDFGEAVAIAAMGLLGIKKMIWIANANACPLCKMLDGKIVSIEGSFLPADSTLDPEDNETTPHTIRRDLKRPPLHKGCACGVGKG